MELCIDQQITKLENDFKNEKYNYLRNNLINIY